ncbi:HAD family hydrolase [Chitinivibrio alkaliphilus]|uniref:phosphoglycolate phosphatase n=1 Tax=Chitinivibrio alkaliphilus ACht1 TaxID=1313304 RepID=U7D981_9BACT|nr:HAD family hydrolase [Chitinivibrio alkaliphilus]ERP31652.1 putative phosphoglycolate phosphatase [Chitinivibrio alkaliphilus ACht1]
MTIKAVFFDLDGTLLNTLGDLCRSLNETLEKEGFPTHSCEAIRRFIGDGVSALVQRALPQEVGAIPEHVAHYTSIYLRNYANVSPPQTHVYEGIYPLLRALKERDIPLAVVTNKPQPKALEIVRKFFPDTFVSICGQRDNYPRKPSPAGALAISKQLKIPPEETFFIGDSEVDLQTASAGGYFGVAALWGFRTRKELEGYEAQHYVQHPKEIVSLLP